MVPTPPAQTVFQLHVELRNVVPAVWRRVLVPGSVKLAKLHEYFQAGMGWTNSHMHYFGIGDDRYGAQFDEYPDGEINERDVTVMRAIGEHQTFVYEYDFGDSWEHDVTVEHVARLPRGLQRAVCLDGANACPPEDCGGPHGYRDLVEALADPTHPEHRDLLDWIGGPFTPTQFDVLAVNVALQGVC